MPQRSDDQIDRRLDQAAAVAFRPESVGLQKVGQRHADVIVAGAQMPGNSPDGGVVGRRRDEFLPQLADDKCCRGRLVEQYIEHGVAVEIAAAAEHGFIAVVMKDRPVSETELARLDTPARESPRRFLDVGLGVAPALRGLTQGEQLHDLAGEVLIRRFLAAIGAIQKNQHRRVFRNRMQQAAEIAQRLMAQQQVLAPHAERADYLLLRRGEVVVPEQRHPLLQRCRRFKHFAHPPDFDVEPFAQLLPALSLSFLDGLQQAVRHGRRLRRKAGRRMKRRGHPGRANEI